MAETPQLENGFLRISNQIVKDWQKLNLSPYQWRVLFHIIAFTYGYNTKKNKISVSHIVNATGIHKANVSRALKELGEKNIVISRDNTRAYNKDSRGWKLSAPITPKKLSVETTKVISRDNKKLSVETDNKDIVKTLKKDNTTALSKDNTGNEVNYLIRLFKDVNPSFTRLYKIKPQREAIENLLKIYNKGQLEKIIKLLAQTNPIPYAPTITTPYVLAMKLGDLKAFIQKEKGKRGQNSFTDASQI